MRFKPSMLTVPGLLLTGISTVDKIIKLTRRIRFRHKVVVITGGSRGLGLVMARQLACQGAKLALLARDENELQIAAEELGLRTQVEYFVCDVCNENEVNQAIASVIEKFGTIDILINNAGVIQVGPLETMRVADFKDAMDNHFFASLYTTLAALPVMKAKKSGRIVNISSIGGKISVPHLLPYSASKFALVGLSEGLRAELLKDNIYVTTVCPGLMRTGSHLQANFKGEKELEYAWFSTLNALPVLSTAAEDAARQVLEACRQGDAELIISAPAALANTLNNLFPEATTTVLGLVNRMLPESTNKKQMFTGKESRSDLSPNPLTTPIEIAAVQNNQWTERMPHHSGEWRPA
ncbi:MAG TPA: SDR family oxidoreductase [Planktothrix sp.]